MPDLDAALLQELESLRAKAEQAQLPEILLEKVIKEIDALKRSVTLGTFDEKFDMVTRYIDWVVRIPWKTQTADQVDIAKAKQIFDQHHYGLGDVKNRFLEYLAVLQLKQQAQTDSVVQAPALLMVGLVGTGKTTFAYSLAEALGRKIVRIPFGGMSSAYELRGRTRLFLESEPGKIVKGLVSAGVRNPVILLDEVDRISEDALSDVMGVLVELLDPAQQHHFVDSYLDYPLDLRGVIFIATANNTTKIVTAVMDRLETIAMPAYTDEEKMVIAQRYVLPQLLKDAGMRSEQLIIQDSVWPRVVRPLGYDAGIRTLQRTLQGAVRKAARILVEKGYPNVVITLDNAKIFLPQY